MNILAWLGLGFLSGLCVSPACELGCVQYEVEV